MLIAGYTIYQLAWYFLLYSFIGWCVEVIFCAVTLGEITNRGFLNGPVCPIYGVGMLAVLILLHFVGQTNASTVPVPLLFFGGALLATLVELIGGWTLNKLFHARWWDYSDKPFNIGGYVCLEFTIFWGLGAVGVVRVVHPLVAHATGTAAIPQNVGWPILAVCYSIYLVDLIVTVCTVIGLNRDLEELDAVSKALRSFSDNLSDNLGGGALLTTQKLDEGKLQVKLATAEARDAAYDARDAAYDAAGRAKVAATEVVYSAKDAAYDAAGRAKVAATEVVYSAKDAACDVAGRAKAAATEAVSTAKASATDAMSDARRSAAETKAALEARAAALRADVLDHPVFGGGRLLRAFPQLASEQYKSMLDDLKGRMTHRRRF